MFFRGFCRGLYLARFPRQTEQLSLSLGEKHRRASSLTEGAFKGKVKR